MRLIFIQNLLSKASKRPGTGSTGRIGGRWSPAQIISLMESRREHDRILEEHWKQRRIVTLIDHLQRLEESRVRYAQNQVSMFSTILSEV